MNRRGARPLRCRVCLLFIHPRPPNLISVPSGDGGNPSPLGEEKTVEVPEGDETPPTEVGGLRMKRAREVDF